MATSSDSPSAPPAHVEAPRGTVALVFTDIQGSTRLWERCDGAMRAALEVHDRVLRAALSRTHGYEVKTQGDSFMLAFASTVDAVRWCLEVQEALPRADWPPELLSEPEAAEERGPHGRVHRGPRVRMGVHVGEPECRVDPRTGRADYFGRMVNATSRVASAGHGGQVLLSGAAWALVADQRELLGRPVVRALGDFRLKGIDEPVSLVEVLPASLGHRRFGGLRVPQEQRGNLSTPVGDLIGRAEELEGLRRWMEEGARLVTILGPGGMGKTTLASHFGGQQLGARAWEGGVWMCDLTEATTVEDVCHAVGEALGVSFSHDGMEGEPAEQLGRALGGRGACLVILDNVEHVVRQLAAPLGRWLTLAPQTRFLVTSREALRLRGERVLDLAPLALPEEGETRWEAIAGVAAVRLFVERARAARGHFEPTAAEAPLVVDIVRRLDGIALAIELAAARARVLGLAQIHERLPRRFELLRGGPRDASARQATLWGALDWSWNLLEPVEQRALAWCSVFHGGFTLEAAEAVLGLPAEGPAVLDVLESLRAKSLLRSLPSSDARGEHRLGMYESIREYASSRLVDVGEAAPLKVRHAEYYLGLAHRLREEPHRGRSIEALRRLSLERDNLLAACDGALAVEPATPESLGRALGALVALEPDVSSRGPVGLTLARLERALARVAQVPVEPVLWAEALAVHGRTCLDTGQRAAARSELERAREAFLRLGLLPGVKRVLNDLSIVAREEGDVAAAWTFVQEARGLPSGGNRWLDAYTLGNVGVVGHHLRGARAAIPHYQEARALFRAVGDVAYEVNALTNGAAAIGEVGDLAEALALLNEAMDKASDAGDRMGHTVARVNLGCYLLEVDRLEEAREHLEEGVRMGRRLGSRLMEGCAQGELARVFLAQGAPESAQARLTEALALLERVSQWHVLRYSAYRAAALAALGRHPSAREQFTAVEQAPEVRDDAVLHELVSLLRASVDLAVVRAAPPGSEEARGATEALSRRLARARSAPAEAASTDLRASLRWLERCWAAR